MKRTVSLGLVLAVAVVLSLPAFADAGEGHAKRAQACVDGGQPMGLLGIEGIAGKRAGMNGLELHAVEAL